MTVPIRLHKAKPAAADTLQVLLIPAGKIPPPHLAGMLVGATISEKLERTAFATDGSYYCLFGLDRLASTKSLRLAAARGVKAFHTIGAKILAFETSLLTDVADEHAVGQALAEGISIAVFETKSYAGAASEKATRAEVAVHLEPRFHQGFHAGLLLGRAINTARELAATPPNLAGPSQLTALAQAVAKKHGMTFRVVDAKAAGKLGMGGLLAVGAGSADAPRLVILEWNPTANKTARPVLLVGKSVTYDSGGLSIKPDGGKGMKSDKSGGCTLLGVMEAIALLKLKTRVVCILAIAENMIDANCFRLDDVITHCNGVTCEITNTDAEGRLVLADALAWGTETYHPTTVIDIATLTGGVLVALGKTTAGVFCNNDELMARLDRAACLSDEKVWRLPLEDELREKMKSGIADLHNSAPFRFAQPGTAAAYLSFFVGSDAPQKMPSTPWIHLDIAGTATTDGTSDWDGLFPEGPTGWGVRTLTRLLADLPG